MKWKLSAHSCQANWSFFYSFKHHCFQWQRLYSYCTTAFTFINKLHIFFQKGLFFCELKTTRNNSIKTRQQRTHFETIIRVQRYIEMQVGTGWWNTSYWKGTSLNYLFVSQGSKSKKKKKKSWLKILKRLKSSVKALIKGQTPLCASIFFAFETSLNFKGYGIMAKGNNALRHQIYWDVWQYGPNKHKTTFITVKLCTEAFRLITFLNRGLMQY